MNILSKSYTLIGVCKLLFAAKDNKQCKRRSSTSMYISKCPLDISLVGVDLRTGCLLVVEPPSDNNVIPL